MRGIIRTRVLKDGTKRYDCRYRTPTNDHRTKTFRRKKDAEAFLDKTCGQLRDGTFREVQSAPMEKVFKTWLSDELDVRLDTGDRMKPSTARTYRNIVEKHFIPAFGDCPSDRLTPTAVAAWRKELAAKVGEGEMSKKTLNNLLGLLRQVLTWAQEPAQGFLKHDPMLGIKRMQVDRADRRASRRDFLQHEEMAALLEACATPEESAAVHLALYCGLRRGELLALKHRDIEAGNNGSGGRVHVRRALSAGKVSTPKTSGSARTVDAPRDVLAALERLRDTGSAGSNDYVFRTPKGTPVDPDNWNTRVWAKLRERAGLRNSIGLHSLRHTFASLLIDNGESIKYVSRQLGHASASFTLDVYGHCFEETSDRAMGRLQEAIRATKRRRFDVLEGGA